MFTLTFLLSSQLPTELIYSLQFAIIFFTIVANLLLIGAKTNKTSLYKSSIKKREKEKLKKACEKLADLISIVIMLSYIEYKKSDIRKCAGVLNVVFKDRPNYSVKMMFPFYNQVISDLNENFIYDYLLGTQEWDYVCDRLNTLNEYCDQKERERIIYSMLAVTDINGNSNGKAMQFIKKVASLFNVSPSYVDSVYREFIINNAPDLWEEYERDPKVKILNERNERIVLIISIILAVAFFILSIKTNAFVAILSTIFFFRLKQYVNKLFPSTSRYIDMRFKTHFEVSVTNEDDNYYNEETFLSSVSALIALVIRRDGDISNEEIGIAKEYFKTQNKKWCSILSRELLYALHSKLKNYRTYCINISRYNARYKFRYNLLEVLYEIAARDNGIIAVELDYLREIARFLRIKKEDRNEIEIKYGVDEETQRKRAQDAYFHNIYIHSRERSLEILGLKSGASTGEIKRAYRRLALKYHPDKQPQNATEEQRAKAEEMFRKINEAYNCLCK